MNVSCYKESIFMEMNIFDFIVDLENDIAELYSRLKSFNNFN